MKVSPSRIRIPGVCLVDKGDRDEIVERPPALWVEILSPDDRWNRIQDRLTDFLSFGVPTIWIVDPYTKEAWIATPDAPVTPVTDGKLRCAALKLEMELNEIFARGIIQAIGLVIDALPLITHSAERRSGRLWLRGAQGYSRQGLPRPRERATQLRT
jgi:hypothetical protein